MDDNYQQFDLQSLLDLLAVETERYTRVFTTGDHIETAFCRMKVNAIITEIHKRKDPFPPENKVQSSLDSSSDAVPTTN